MDRHHDQFGGAFVNLFEPQALTISVKKVMTWQKAEINLKELAKLHWEFKWNRKKLSKHFGLGITTISNKLREIKEERVK